MVAETRSQSRRRSFSIELPAIVEEHSSSSYQPSTASSTSSLHSSSVEMSNSSRRRSRYREFMDNFGCISFSRRTDRSQSTPPPMRMTSSPTPSTSSQVTPIFTSPLSSTSSPVPSTSQGTRSPSLASLSSTNDSHLPMEPMPSTSTAGTVAQRSQSPTSSASLSSTFDSHLPLVPIPSTTQRSAEAVAPIVIPPNVLLNLSVNVNSMVPARARTSLVSPPRLPLPVNRSRRLFQLAVFIGLIALLLSSFGGVYAIFQIIKMYMNPEDLEFNVIVRRRG